MSFNALLLTETGRERLQEISSVAFEKAMSQDKMLFLDIHDSQKSDNEDSVHSSSHTNINISERTAIVTVAMILVMTITILSMIPTVSGQVIL